MLVHHSRNSEQKQWDETLVLALAGMARLLKSHLALLLTFPAFPVEVRPSMLVPIPAIRPYITFHMPAFDGMSAQLTDDICQGQPWLSQYFVGGSVQKPWVMWMHVEDGSPSKGAAAASCCNEHEQVIASPQCRSVASMCLARHLAFMVAGVSVANAWWLNSVHTALEYPRQNVQSSFCTIHLLWSCINTELRVSDDCAHGKHLLVKLSTISLPVLKSAISGTATTNMDIQKCRLTIQPSAQGWEELMKVVESCMASGRKETAIAAIAIIASTVQVMSQEPVMYGTCVKNSCQPRRGFGEPDLSPCVS